MHRRTFVRGLGAALALPAALRAYPVDARRVERIGIQLYSLRDAAKADLERTLGEIAAVGYRQVELLESMHNFDMPPERLRKVLDGLHLRAPSTHIGTDALDDLPRVVDHAHTLGHTYVVVASLPMEPSKATLDDYRHWADRFNAAGETMRRAGLWLGFHDEPENFAPIDGQVPYDVLVARTDPALVRLQLDTGNAALGGRDPLPYMERYGDRYWLFHLKDAARLGAPHDAELGTGVVDFKRLLARAGSLADKYVYVEQESYPGTPLDSARRDYKYLASLTY
ncbi:xylose isomerase [Gemmatimonadetes bacterium T265]|nr:xylose isomerase [Gemmatimonadetes bacterium T265]